MTGQVSPQPAEKWKRGDEFVWTHGRTAKVMAVADGYLMCRFPRCYPFLVHQSEVKNLAVIRRG